MVRNSKILFVGCSSDTFYLTPKQGNTTAPENTHKCGGYWNRVWCHSDSCLHCRLFEDKNKQG